MHNIKRLRKEKTNTNIFTWFGNFCLRTRLQAHSLEDFTVQPSKGFMFLQLTSKVSMNLYNQEIISPISSPQVFLTLVHSQFDEK